MGDCWLVTADCKSAPVETLLGSIPRFLTNSQIAQLEEHLICNQAVVSSSLSLGAI